MKATARDERSEVVSAWVWAWVMEVSRELESVFTLDVFTVVEPGLRIPPEVLETIESEGFTWMPNAKINMGLGRAWEKG